MAGTSQQGGARAALWRPGRISVGGGCALPVAGSLPVRGSGRVQSDRRSTGDLGTTLLGTTWGGGGGGEHWQDRPSRCVLGMGGSRTSARDMTRGDTYNQSSEVEEHGHGRSKRRRVLPTGWTLAAGCGGTAARVRTKPNHRHLGVAPCGGRVAYGHHRRRRPRDTGTRTTPAREVTRPVQPPHLPIAPIHPKPPVTATTACPHPPAHSTPPHHKADRRRFPPRAAEAASAAASAPSLPPSGTLCRRRRRDDRSSPRTSRRAAASITAHSS